LPPPGGRSSDEHAKLTATAVKRTAVAVQEAADRAVIAFVTPSRIRGALMETRETVNVNVNAPTERRILRRAEVEQKTGFKRAHLYTLMREGKFPKALRLGIRAVGWDSVEIDAWIAERLRQRI
jgi:prophage regulatory protein